MKKKIKIYLDTSIVSALFDDRNPERKILTEAFFRQLGEFDPYISEVTVAEIERTPDTKLKDRIKKSVADIQMLDLTDEAEGLADEYIRHGAVPGGYSEDAVHIALAVLYDMDFLLSWNFKHIVRRKTKDIVNMVNTLRNLRHVEIMTPAELL